MSICVASFVMENIIVRSVQYLSFFLNLFHLDSDVLNTLADLNTSSDILQFFDKNG